MLIAIKSCEAHWDRCDAIRSTWWTPEVHFFTGPELDIPDDYANLPLKTQAICKWAIKRGHLWTFFCDTDTYVHVPRLKKSIFPTDYSGYLLPEGYCSGGAGYMLSREAMSIVADYKDAGQFAFEDKMVGAALAQDEIEPFHNPLYALYDDVLPGNEVISRHLSSRGPYKIEYMYAAHRRANG